MKSYRLAFALVGLVLVPAPSSGWHRSDCEAVADCIRQEEERQRQRGGLGIRIRVVDDADEYKPRVVFAVGEVYPRSPADRAGLRKGDGILAINGRVLRQRDAAFFLAFHRDLEIGSKVTYAVVRGFEILDIPMVAGPRHPDGIRGWIERHLRDRHPPQHLTAYLAYLERKAEDREDQE